MKRGHRVVHTDLNLFFGLKIDNSYPDSCVGIPAR